MTQHHDTTTQSAGIPEEQQDLSVAPSFRYRVLAAVVIGLVLIAITYAVISVLAV